jgi:hypothetical protein
MLKLICVTCICLGTLPAFGQSASKYEVATITDVKTHQDSGSDVARYDVSVKVGGTIYVVLYTPPLGLTTVKYAAGRELLVLVGEKNNYLQRHPGSITRSADREPKSATKQPK